MDLRQSQIVPDVRDGLDPANPAATQDRRRRDSPGFDFDGPRPSQRKAGALGSSADRHRASRSVRLLEVAPELGSELTDEERAAAHQHAVLPSIALGPGPWEPTAAPGAGDILGEVRGFLVLSGGLTSEALIAGRPCSRLIGPGELVLLDGDEIDSIPVSFTWSVLMPARVALFDDRLLAIGRHWPGLLSTILRRSAQTARNGLLQQAISQLPRIEDRLLALLWTLADRQGVVRADGVWLELRVTHATLALMIGARRPTVTLAVRALTEQGHLRAERGGWLLSPSSLEQLTPTRSDPEVEARR